MHGLRDIHTPAQLAAGACAGECLGIWSWSGRHSLDKASWLAVQPGSKLQRLGICSNLDATSSWWPFLSLWGGQGNGKAGVQPSCPSTKPSSHHQAINFCACLCRQQLMSVLGKEMAQQVFNPPAATPSQTAPTSAASSLAPAAGDAELDELHSQADRAIPSTQSAEQLGGSSGRKRKFTLQANPSLASTAKGARGLRPTAWGSCCL